MLKLSKRVGLLIALCGSSVRLVSSPICCSSCEQKCKDFECEIPTWITSRTTETHGIFVLKREKNATTIHLFCWLIYVFTVLHIYNHRYVALCSVLSFSDYRNLPFGYLARSSPRYSLGGRGRETWQQLMRVWYSSECSLEEFLELCLLESWSLMF